MTMRNPFRRRHEPGWSDRTVELEVVGEPVPRRKRVRGWLATLRPTALAMFAGGFLFLLGAVAAVGFAQFTGSSLAPRLSIGYSGAAVICTVASLVMARER